MNPRQFTVLYRHFLFKVIDLDVLSQGALGDSSKLYGQFAAILVFMSVMMGWAGAAYGMSVLSREVRYGTALVMEHFLISTTMLVVGLFAVLAWDSTFPERRDVMVLAPLPVRARTFFFAKIAAVASSLGLLIALLHCLGGIAWPLAIAGTVEPVTVPALTFDSARPGLSLAEIQADLDRGLAGPLRDMPRGGLTIGILRHGERRVFTYGSARTDSIFEIASISKTFTALMLGRMVAAGRVQLDTPLRLLLPPGTVFAPRGREMTLLDLATHHSGIQSTDLRIEPADISNPAADYGVSNLYRFIHHHGVARPDEVAYEYSNLNFALLGQALANREGVSYAALLDRLITRPLGLQDTMVALTPERKARMIQGYNRRLEAIRPWDMDALAPAGGIHSTADDLLTYLNAYLHPDLPGIVETETLHRGSAMGMRIALAWMYRPEAGIYWHNGATGGYTSSVFFDPRDDYATAVLLNTGPPRILVNPDVIAEHIRQRLAGEDAVSLETATVPVPRGFAKFARGLAAYWITMLAAGAFIFLCVLGLQGLAAQLLPRRLFLRASGFLQIATFVVFVCGYFLQPMFSGLEGLLAPDVRRILPWLPPNWFLGVYQQISGMTHPALVPLARRAWIGLGTAFVVTAIAYVLSYLRTLRRIVEEPDIAPGSRTGFWLPSFGRGPQTAIVHFGIRTLLRSRRHRLLLAFYLGLGFAITVFFVKSPVAQKQIESVAESAPMRHVNAPMLASSIVMLCFWIAGARVIFSMPLDLKAGWILRVLPLEAGRSFLRARRRALLALSVLPCLLLAAAIFVPLWPLRAAALHLTLLAAFSALLVELCLLGQQKFPFACSYLPGKSSFHITFWMCVYLFVAIIDRLTEWERLAFDGPAAFAAMIAVLVVTVIVVRRVTASNADDAPIQFDDDPPPTIQQLGLSVR